MSQRYMKLGETEVLRAEQRKSSAFSSRTVGKKIFGLL